MPERDGVPLRLVDGLELDREYRDALRPGELVKDRNGRLRRLPRFFYEVESWRQARDVRLAPHFMVAEFLDVDVREAEPLRRFPRYVPCAITLLATHLEMLRLAVGTFVFISANGGYRSPAHRLLRYATPHCWGTGADLYRIGDTYLHDREVIEKYSRIAAEVSPAFHTLPFGHGVGEVDDHVHLDLGFVVQVPQDAPSEADAEQRQTQDERPGGPGGGVE